MPDRENTSATASRRLGELGGETTHGPPGEAPRAKKRSLRMFSASEPERASVAQNEIT